MDNKESLFEHVFMFEIYHVISKEFLLQLSVECHTTKHYPLASEEHEAENKVDKCMKTIHVDIDRPFLQ